jgi:DNA repair exonuclease SbcCD ATPase subunit
MDSVSVNLLKIDVVISTGQLVMEQCCMDLLKHATNYFNGQDRINKTYFEGLHATNEQLSEACALMDQFNIPEVSKAVRVSKIEEMKLNIDYMIETYSRSINSISTILAEKHRLVANEKDNLVSISKLKEEKMEIMGQHKDMLSRYGEMAEALANNANEDKDTEISELKHEIEVLRSNLEKDSLTKQKQTDIFNSQTYELEMQNEKVSELTKIIESDKTKITSLSNELEMKNKKINVLVQYFQNDKKLGELTQDNSEINNMREKMDNLSEKHENLKLENSIIKNNFSQLQIKFQENDSAFEKEKRMVAKLNEKLVQKNFIIEDLKKNPFELKSNSQTKPFDFGDFKI